MTYTANDPRTLIDAILARLDAQTTLLIGDGTKPSGITYDDDDLPTSPYVVVYPLPDDNTSGTLSDPDSDVWWAFQCTVVGGSRQQAAWGQDAVRTALLGWAPTVSGLLCSKVELEQGSGVDRDDDVQPPLFFSADSFRLFSSPT